MVGCVVTTEGGRGWFGVIVVAKTALFFKITISLFNIRDCYVARRVFVRVRVLFFYVL